MTPKMKRDLMVAANYLADGKCVTLLTALLANNINVFYVIDTEEWNMTSEFFYGKSISSPFFKTKQDYRNYWLTRIAMMLTMPKEIVEGKCYK